MKRVLIDTALMLMENIKAECGNSAFDTLLALLYYANSQTGECFPSIETIAEKSVISRRQTIYNIKRLEKQNYITITKIRLATRKQKNRYTFPALEKQAQLYINSQRTKPTQEEALQFCKEHNIDYIHYLSLEDKDFKDAYGMPIKNWKSYLLTYSPRAVPVISACSLSHSSTRADGETIKQTRSKHEANT